jgi:hypothetical protein
MRKRLFLVCLLSLAATGVLAVPSEVEPLAGSGLRASLAPVEGNPGKGLALVQVKLVSQDADAVSGLSVSSVTSEGQVLRTTPLASATRLSRGVEMTLLVSVAVDPGRENHLVFTADMQKANGTTSRATSYLRVNLDPSLDPVVIDGVAEFKAKEVAQ